MSVSLLPSSLVSSLRVLLHSLSSAGRALVVSEARGELGALLKQFGLAARLQALSQAAATVLHNAEGGVQQQQAQQQTPAQSPTNAGASSGSSSPPPSALGSKALEAWLSEEVAELQRREPARWPALLAKVLEAAAAGAQQSAQQPASPQHKGVEESMVARFGGVANLSLRHQLLLALQLSRSPLPRMQAAGLHFVSQQLSWALASPSAAPDNKAWWTLPDDLLNEVAQLVSAPAFPLSTASTPATQQEQRQQLLHALSKLQGQHREAKQREEAAELQAAVSAHANATSAVADVLQDLGYSISSSIESLKDTLHPFPKLTEQDVASILVMILRTQYAKLHQDGADDSGSSAPPPATAGGKGKGNKGAAAASSDAPGEGWHIPHVIDAIKELSSSSHSSGGGASRLNWKSILENEIDHPRLVLADERAFTLYVDIYRYATTGVWTPNAPANQQTFHLPSLDFLLRDWKHTAAHMSMLRWALPAALTVFSYLPPTLHSNAHAARNARSMLAAANAGAAADSAEHDADESSTVMSVSSSGGHIPANSRYQSWVSFDLLESLMESVAPSASPSPSASSSQPSSVAQSLYVSLRSLLSLAIERCPELMMTGLLSMRSKGRQHPSVVKDELLACVLPVHVTVAPHAATAQAFQKLWEGAGDNKAAAGRAATFWVMRYFMHAGNNSSSVSSSLLPPLLVSLGNSLRAFLEKLLSGASTPFTMDLQTAPSGVSGSVVPFHAWFTHKYASDMTSNNAKELFLAILFAFVKEHLVDAQPRVVGAAADAGAAPNRLSVESAAILLKTLLTTPNSPPALINDVQSFYAQHAPHFQQLQSTHMQQIVGTTIALSTQMGQQHLQQQQQAQQQHAGISQLTVQHPSQHITAMGGAGAALNMGITNTGANQLVDTSLSAGAGAPSGGAAPSGSAHSDDIEEEANSYFQKLYTGAMSLDSVVEMLLRFRASSSQRERDVCVCMIHNLFDEYKFFCLSDDHQALVRGRGWQDLRNVHKGDEVWSLTRLGAEEACWSTVTHSPIELPLEVGQMMHQLQTPEMHLLATEDHAHWVREPGQTMGAWRMERSDKLGAERLFCVAAPSALPTFQWPTLSFLPADINTNHAKQTAWCALLGFFVVNGSLRTEDKIVSLAPAGSTGLDELAARLRELEWDVPRNGDEGLQPSFARIGAGFEAQSAILYDYLLPMFGQGGEGSERSVHYEWRFSLDIDQSRAFLSGVLAAIGESVSSEIKTALRCSTLSASLRDDLVTLAALAGWPCSAETELSSLDKAATYVLSFPAPSAAGPRAAEYTLAQGEYNVRVLPPSASAWCLKVESGNFLTRRAAAGVPMHSVFTGNCKYPLKELQITGLLFGALVAHKLVSNFTLGIALRFVLEALRKPADSKMFNFGLIAIGQFKQRIQHWPHYAMLILHSPHIQTAQPELANFLQQVVMNHADAAAAANIPPGEQLDFSATGSAFGAGFNADPQSFSTFASLTEAERHADMQQASAARSALDRAAAVANISADSHLPPGLGLGATAKPLTAPGTAMAASVVLGGGANAPSNPAGAIGARPTAGAPAAGTASASSFGSTLNIDSLLSAEGEAPLPLAPSESLKDKIHFIINSLSFGSGTTKSNLRQKGRELKLILRPEYLPYFSRYLVIKRVSIEANFQRLYAAFLDYVGVTDLRKVLLETTYYNIRVLLKNDKIVSSSSERSLLKNLGSWLGLLTIARNKPIRAKYLDVKSLILDAYDHGRLIAVIPFAAKVLESCAESRVFKPPNPWLMAVVGLLREIFDLPGLKLNLKFEIEVLFNHLQINMKEIKSTNLLQHRKMHVGNSRENEKQRQEQRRQLAAQQAQQQAGMPGAAGATAPFPLLPTPNPLPPLSKSGVPPLKSGAPLGAAGGPARSPSPNMSEEEARASAGMGLAGSTAAFGASAGATGAGGLPLQSGAGGAGGADSLLLPNLSAYVVISPSIGLFQMFPALKRCVPTAIDRAIREIINPVVERSLAIACVTTRELILKDYALEPDEVKMRAAANQMVANLTSSLALVTCKEPLRVSITNHLNQLLEQNTNPNERAMLERACLQVASDNLELGTALIEKSAAERAIREIDEQLAPVYHARIKHRQTTGQGYVDMSYFQPGNRYPAALPEALRAKPGVGLSPSQLRVYEDFSRIRSQHAAAAAAAPQTGAERPVMKDATGAPAGLAGQTTLLRPEDADKKGAAFAAPSTGGAVAQRVPGVPQQQQLAAGPGLAAPGAPGSAPSTRSPPLGAASIPSNLTAQQTLDKLLGYLATLEQAVLRFPNHKSIPLHSLTTAVAQSGQTLGQREGSPDQEINVLMRLMAALLSQTVRDEQNYPKDLVPLTFALKVFKRLYERENRSSLLQIDVHIGTLKCIRAVCPKLLPELTAWLLYADDDRKFILPITAGLLRARLLNTAELDQFLSKLALQIFNSGQAVATTTQTNPAAPAGSPPTQVQVLHPQFEFILTLVRRVVVKRPIVSVGELATLLETLNKIGQQAQRTKLLADHIAHLLEDVRTAALLAEKERSEQERAARAGAEGIDASKLGGGDPALNAAGGAPGLPLSLLDSDAPDALDRVLENDEPEPAGLHQQVMYLLDDWMNICMQQGASDKAYSAYLGMLQQQRLLATPDATQKFFRVIIQLAVEAALSSLANPPADGAAAGSPPAMSYTALDALAKLFVFLLKFLEQPTGAVGPNGQPLQAPNSTGNKLLLLRSFLSAAVFVLRKDQAHKSALLAQALQAGAQPPANAIFNQRPYLRLFTNLLYDLNTPDPLLDSNNSEVLALLATHFRFLRPQRCPAFLLAWLELISHRMFMSKLLLSKQSGCSVLLARLLVDLFRFLQPYLRQAELSGALRHAYKGTLRLLLVLLHDFPEFLCEFHSSFCDVIPPSCIQMRNLILSAFPRSMRLPDPFTPNLKVDLLTEMQQAPRISNDAALLLQQPMHRHTLLMPLEHYLKHREPASFFTQLLDSLTLRSTILHTPHAGAPTGAQLEQMHAQAVKRAGTTYNVPLINALVLYTGLAGIAQLLQSAGKSNGGLVSSFADSAAMDVYEAMLSGLDAEGRYYVLNAIANQLRFPNNHTHYFSCVLLYLFLQSKDSKDEVLMELMTRVLLERLIVHRPHPWGLLITFIELIKNPRYAFWSMKFTKCAPEIERLFESVARSCMPAKQTTNAAAGAAPQGPSTQGAVGTQPGANGAPLGSSLGAGNAGAGHPMLSPSPRIHDAANA